MESNSQILNLTTASIDQDDPEERKNQQRQIVQFNSDEVMQKIISSKEKIDELKSSILNKEIGFLERKMFGCQKLKEQLFLQLDKLKLQIQCAEKLFIQMNTNGFKNKIQIILKSGQKINAGRWFQYFFLGATGIISIFTYIFSVKQSICGVTFLISKLSGATWKTVAKTTGIAFAVGALAELAFACYNGKQTKNQWDKALKQTKQAVKGLKQQCSQIKGISRK